MTLWCMLRYTILAVIQSRRNLILVLMAYFTKVTILSFFSLQCKLLFTMPQVYNALLDIFIIEIYSAWEMLEDTKGLTRSLKSKDR